MRSHYFLAPRSPLCIFLKFTGFCFEIGSYLFRKKVTTNPKNDSRIKFSCWTCCYIFGNTERNHCTNIISLSVGKRGWNVFFAAAKKVSSFTLISVFVSIPDQHIPVTFDGQTWVKEQFLLVIRNFHQQDDYRSSAIIMQLMENKGWIPNPEGGFRGVVSDGWDAFGCDRKLMICLA